MKSTLPIKELSWRIAAKEIKGKAKKNAIYLQKKQRIVIVRPLFTLSSPMLR